MGDSAVARRSTRGSVNKPAILERLKEGRKGAIQVCTEAKINGPEYLAAQVVTDAIDTLAEEITGDRKHFGERVHTVRNGHK